MLPFEHVVPEEARIAGLEDQLVTAEGPAILAWAIRGAADYFTHGLAEPPAARAATIAYERDTDTVARFVDERCSVGSPNSQLHHVKSSALRSAYEAWCRTEGEEPVSPKALSQQLVARFSARLNRDTAARWIDGIRLLEPVTDEADASSAEPRDGYEIERENGANGAAVDPTTCMPRWYGDPLDLDAIVSGLLATEPAV